MMQNRLSCKSGEGKGEKGRGGELREMPCHPAAVLSHFLICSSGNAQASPSTGLLPLVCPEGL